MNCLFTITHKNISEIQTVEFSWISRNWSLSDLITNFNSFSLASFHNSTYSLQTCKWLTKMTTLSWFPLGKSLNPRIVLDSFGTGVQNRTTWACQIWLNSDLDSKVQYCSYQSPTMGDTHILRELPFSTGNCFGILFWLRE